jgi:hypothetical protein
MDYPALGRPHPPAPGQARPASRARRLGGSLQPLHFLHEFQAELRCFVVGQPIGHVGEHGLPQPGIAFRPWHLLGGPRLFEQCLQALANLLRVGEVAADRCLQAIVAVPEQAALHRTVPEQIDIVRHCRIVLRLIRGVRRTVLARARQSSHPAISPGNPPELGEQVRPGRVRKFATRFK